jgi:Co/Zn/Cd efflux system component
MACCDDNCVVEQLRERQRGTLKAVLFINLVMFFVIATSAFYGKSAALFSTSFDNLGDALTYGLSLYVVSKSNAEKAKVALFKGGLIFMGACAVLAQIVQKLIVPIMPSYEIMGVFSLVDLTTNSLCLYLLWKHRTEDINMSSVWECSRNDIFVNLSVFVAAGAVWFFESRWADIIVASCLVTLLFRSSFHVIKAALLELKNK